MSGRVTLWRGLLGAVCLLVLWAPGAWALAPANDDFADALPLVGSLPIGLSATNAEATKESGEPLHGPLGAKGHSVWFEWEATVSGFVTVGTCGSDFRTVTGVYIGTKVDELIKAAGDFGDEGPGCPFFEGREITFKAISGTTYEIAIDGDPFYVPPSEPPLGEGSIELQLRLTPRPANDDFVGATPLIGSTEEEEGRRARPRWRPGRRVGLVQVDRPERWQCADQRLRQQPDGDRGLSRRCRRRLDYGGFAWIRLRPYRAGHRGCHLPDRRRWEIQLRHGRPCARCFPGLRLNAASTTTPAPRLDCRSGAPPGQDSSEHDDQPEKAEACEAARELRLRVHGARLDFSLQARPAEIRRLLLTGDLSEPGLRATRLQGRRNRSRG
jgi:hypothetical protein